MALANTKAFLVSEKAKEFRQEIDLIHPDYTTMGIAHGVVTVEVRLMNNNDFSIHINTLNEKSECIGACMQIVKPGDLALPESRRKETGDAR